ncbi:MAG: 3-hydroxyacyl-CoA dehydrogenase/enoyl-CoA hydratase family protein [Gaiellales bacterium]|nr:3-hydroxyacyl-CoA dehydrogenase/enoyl-CoA hydratase family protein [Gaiellales bacterium]
MTVPALYPGFRNPLLDPPRITMPAHVAMVGAGTIGPDIGYYLKLALPDMKLTLVDVVQEPLDAAKARFEGYAAKSVKRGKMKPDMVDKVLGNIVYSTDYDAIADADLVIEAATENIPLKKKIFGMIEERVAPETIIASNTSSIPAETIFADMKYPGRTAVTHFFAPAWYNPCVEVVTWAKSDRATVDYLTWLFCATGKTPVVTADVVCFMLDRIFDNWVNEAAYQLDRATALEVDKVAEEFCAAGPLWVVDMSNGNLIVVETNGRQQEAEGDCYKPAKILESVVRWRVATSRDQKVDVPEEVRSIGRTRFQGILFSQSLDIVARKVGTPEDLDLGCTLALGFKKGPLQMMQEMGKAGVQKVLQDFEADRPGFPGLNYLDRFEELTTYNQYILVDRLEDVVIITIRRPAQMNAITDKVNDEILAVLKQYETDESVTGFVITGYGPRAFCAGGDIGRFPEMLGDAAAAAQYARDSSHLLTYMDTMRKPVVAAVNGLALGGGSELAMRCHGLVASSKATFQFPEITLGILPGIGGLIVPFRKWPKGAAKFTAMLCRNDRLSAKDALELGVVSALEDDYWKLVQLAADRARALSGAMPTDQPSGLAAADIPEQEATQMDGTPLSAQACGIILDAVRAGVQEADLGAALETGYRAFGKIAEGPAAKEGIGAFLGKRKPDFSRM